jgi:hypothetical protein
MVGISVGRWDKNNQKNSKYTALMYLENKCDLSSRNIACKNAFSQSVNRKLQVFSKRTV